MSPRYESCSNFLVHDLDYKSVIIVRPEESCSQLIEECDEVFRDTVAADDDDHLEEQSL